MAASRRCPRADAPELEGACCPEGVRWATRTPRLPMMKGQTAANHVEAVRDAAEVSGGSALVAARLARLEQEVADGVRDARSLVVFPRDLVARAVVTFPPDAFGPAEPW